jgi:DNA polymerase-1
MFPHLVTDFGKIGLTNVVWTPPRFRVIHDPMGARAAFETLQERAEHIVIDIEAGIEKDTAFDHPNQYDMLCIGIGYQRSRALVLARSALQPDVYDGLGRLLRSKKVICQNGKFDLAGLYPHLGGVELYFDTMLASYVFDERPRIHGLKHQAVEYLGAPQYDLEIQRYIGKGRNYSHIPPDILHKYNAYDVACTWDLFELYGERFGRKPELRRVHDFLVAASNQLMFVELNGIAVDREYLDTLTTQYLDVLEGIEKDIDSVLGTTINPRSPKQVAAAIQDTYHLRLPLKRSLQTGEMRPTTDQEALEGLLERQRPESEPAEFLRSLLRHRRESKLYGTYVKGARKRLYRGRLYPTFLLHGTTTGRLSCRNPNLQNVPRESSIRRLYVPAKDGNVFVQSDYSQAELRVLSYLAGDTYFRDIFNAGDRDLFEELTPILYPQANKAELGPAKWKELRIRVKAYVYGVSYGRTAYSIALEFGIPESAAQAGMNAFFNVIPEIVEFREKTKKRVLGGNDLVTPFGRHRRFMLITQENVKEVMNEALAFLPQSTASDMCLQAFTKIRPQLKGIGWVRNIVHDSILAECPANRAEEVAALMDHEMVESARSIVGDYVRFATDYKIGSSWGAV